MCSSLCSLPFKPTLFFSHSLSRFVSLTLFGFFWLLIFYNLTSKGALDCVWWWVLLIQYHPWVLWGVLPRALQGWVVRKTAMKMSGQDRPHMRKNSTGCWPKCIEWLMSMLSWQSTPRNDLFWEKCICLLSKKSRKQCWNKPMWKCSPLNGRLRLVPISCDKMPNFTREMNTLLACFCVFLPYTMLTPASLIQLNDLPLYLNMLNCQLCLQAGNE